MAYSAYFNIKYLLTEGSFVPYAKSYDFWKAMIQKISQKVTEFEIRCWENEEPAIETGEKFGKRADNFVTKEIVYQGKVTKDFITEILNSYLTGNGRLKWFSIFFKKDNKIIFSSEHYGTEIIMHNINDEEIEAVRKYPGMFQEIDVVHIWEENI